MTIGSFNVLNFNPTRETRNKRHPANWREIKVKSIADIVKANQMDIVALQELKGGERSVAEIVGNLPGGYGYLHINKIYAELKAKGYSFPSEKESSGELAFIYKLNTVDVAFDDEHCNMYVEMYRQLQIKYRELVDVLTGLAVGALELFPEKNSGHSESQKWGGVIAVKATGNIFGDVEARKKIASMIESIIRPPLICFFNINNSQLRFVNAHVRWNLTASEKRDRQSNLLHKSAEILREEEVKFILGYLFKYVDSYPVRSISSRYTVVGGDFNMSCQEMTRMTNPIVDSRMMVVQEGLSHLIMANKKEVQAEHAYPKYVGNENYDHFVFRKEADIWSAWTNGKKHSTAKVCNNDDADRYFLISDDNDEKYKWNISDHYPIKMRSEKI